MAIPKPKVFWPLVINSTNKWVDVLVGGVTTSISVPEATYYSAKELADAIQTAMAGIAGSTFAVIVGGTDGIFTFARAEGAFTLKWNTGANAANSLRDVLGFFAADAASVANAVVSPRQHLNGWYSTVAVRSDSRPRREDANAVITVAQSGATKYVGGPASLIVREINFAWLPAERTFIDDDLSFTNDGRRAIENWWLNGRGRFRYWPDQTVEVGVGASFDYALDMSVIEKFTPSRTVAAKALYSIGPWKFRRYV